jgi:hypothetical protein
MKHRKPPPRAQRTETIKHVRRKATPEQVSAMNRELELRGARYRFHLEEGRLVQKTLFTVDW